LDDLGLDTLNRAKVAKLYTAGQSIFCQGDRCFGLHYLGSGTAATRKVNSHGVQTITRLHGSGDMLGARAYFANGAYDVTAEAMTECEVCFIHGEAARELMSRYPAVEQRLHVRLACDSEQTEDWLLDLLSLPVSARLARVLLTLKDHFASTDENGHVVLKLPLSRMDLASMVVARPESLSRAIHSLEQAGVARFEGRSVTIPDLDLLLHEIERTARD
jgi:CRP/FNR family transcriptional regulator